MSAVGSPPPPDTMRTYMLRSSTPASNEKVLLYLESLRHSPPGPDENDAATNNSSQVHSPAPRGSVASNARHLEDLADEHVSYNGMKDDIRSDVQEAPGSDVARTIAIQTTGPPDHEPGPDDPPGPRFESYGSSFGNFGPLRDSLPAAPNNWNNQPWSPSKAAGVPLPATVVASSPTGDSHMNPFVQYGMTPAGGINIGGAEPPQSPGPRSKVASKVSNGNVMTPKAPSRAMSPARTANGAPPTERPWSPKSNGGASQVKSRVTQKSSRTQYPPLPESVAEEATQRALSPPPRTHNRSPSISPSESASQVRPRSTRPRETKAKSMKSITEVDSQAHESQQQQPPPPPSRSAASQRDARSQAPMSPRSHASQQVPLPSQRTGVTNDEMMRAASVLSPTRSKRNLDPEATPTPSRPSSPVGDLNPEELKMVNDVLLRPPRTRTSYAASAAAPSMLEPEVQNSHFHDMELCQLLHSLDQPGMSEPVKRAVRKAVRTRVKKLGMKYDNESLRQYRKSFHDHDPSIHMAMIAPSTTLPNSKRSTQVGSIQEPPEWARDLMMGMANMRERLDDLAPKIEKSLQTRSSRGGSYLTEGRSYQNGHQQYGSEMNGAYTQSPITQTTHILANQQTGTMADESMFQQETEVRDSTHLHTLPGSVHHHDGSMHGIPEEDDMYEDDPHQNAPTDVDTRGLPSEYNDREYSPGQQYLEEELFKLRVKPTTGTQSVATHKTWELTRDDGGEDYDDEADAQAAVTESGLPEIPPDGTTGGAYTERRSPPLPPIPAERSEINMPEPQIWQQGEYGHERGPPPWQRVHQRLLSWAIVWPMMEFDNALNSTTRGHQVDEIALSIWSTQTYKRYVRAKMTDSPPGRVDRLFVPPNMADAISTAVYNGRHGDACGMLRDLWAPFGLEGIPRLLIVLAKHRSDDDHWVVHRFSLPDGSLTTYDTYPERCLPDGRPLGWWFAIRIAWPDAIYPSPDHLMQKMVRLHRPMQLGIDNSVAAAGIWRNLLMGSRAERSLDLERLRDLINTEVKNLRQRKMMGKLSIGSPRANWEDMN
ncbi:hypothetical protein C8Q75DRAFT_549078 [Abortiporus biennis]|nr:hypothetical protein C8Q75DRAFT_549078 [Abortiporus biennis]